MSTYDFNATRARVLFFQIQEMLARMPGNTLLEDKDYSLPEMEEMHKVLLTLFARSEASKQTFYSYDVPQAVRRVLDSAMAWNTRVRIWIGDTETGRSFNDEYDVIGTVARSTGVHRVPLLIPNSRSSGGPAILTSCIIRIDDVSARRTLYQHPNFSVEGMEVQPSVAFKDYPFEVINKATREVVARFKNELGAMNWIGFMHGHRYAK